jgi:geranylgeranyl transferase type-2 subunit beta
MQAEPYLLRLALRLAEGLARLPEEPRVRHAAYLAAAQNADGGFSGRQGGSDLYYTGFALRGLAVLDALPPQVCERAAPFLRHSLSRQAGVVDLFSLLYSCLLVQAASGPAVLADSSPDWPDRVATALETFRTAEGGYAKAAGSPASSTYHTFLAGLCYQLVDRPWPRTKAIIGFIQSRQRDDGGYVELAPMRRSGTNPTAAAVGTLQVFGDKEEPGFALHPEAVRRVVDFLAGMQSPEGGLRANSRAPLADLLSTFTGLWTLDQLGGLDRVDRKAALRYVELLELEGGGFRGGLWDDHTDVEYTFYGLGCLALLTPAN